LHFGIRADGAADDLGGVQSLSKKLTGGFTGRFLYPCSDLSPQQTRIASLASHGIELVPVNFYRNEPVATRPLPRLMFTRVLFTSSSTVDRYFRDYPAELRASRTWLAVGPSTLRSLEALGLDADVIDG
jgi:uroporphyrinogen-III synthase